MNRLGLIEVLERAWKPVNRGAVAISAHSGDRHRESRGTRFIVREGGKAICTVKRLPLAGPFDLEAILATQKAFGALKTVRVPEVFGSIRDDENGYIVEQFVAEGMPLDDAVRNRIWTQEDAEKLLGDLLGEIYATPLGPIDPKVDEVRILSAIERCRLTALQKASLRHHIFEVLSDVWHAPVWTTRDFLPRNILLSEGRPFLVDFDLARRTGLLGMDVLRIELYTGWHIPFWPAVGAKRDDLRMALLSLILEEELQRTIAGGEHYRKWVETYAREITRLADYLPTDYVVKKSGEALPGHYLANLLQESPKKREPAISGPITAQSLAQIPSGRPPGLRGRVRHALAKARQIRAGLLALTSDVVRGGSKDEIPWQSNIEGELKYWIDAPGDWESPDQTTTVTGWCFSASPPISGVRAVVNGQVFPGTYGGERPDVKQAMGLPSLNLGYYVRCPVKRGVNEVVLEAHLGDKWVAMCRSNWRAPYVPGPPSVPDTYQKYVDAESVRLQLLSKSLSEEALRFKIKPVVSVVMPVYRTPVEILAKAVESVRHQIYPNWQLCIVDDASNDPALSEYLQGLAADARINVKVREKNGNISAATNDAFAMAHGEWIAFLDHDDELSPDALFEVVAEINDRPGSDVIYTDQDKIDEAQHRREPFFKPDWSPVFLRGVMYLGHLLVARRNLILEAGGCDSRFDGVQDFEMALRLSERTARIRHVPRILYHWRAIRGSVAADGSAKSNIDRLQELAVQEHMDRLGIAAAARGGSSGHRVRIVARPRSVYPKISILIPTRDHPELIGRCLNTIFERTSYPNFEVVIGDNETRNPKAIKVLDSFPVKVIPLSGEFHFARFNNILAEQAAGEYLMLLNNDTEIVQPDWLEQLLVHAEQETVGAAGAVLTYEDGTIQHAGIILGPRGTADHVMRGFPADSDGYFGSLACAREVTAVTAAAALVQRRKFMLVGGLCQRFQRHYDDLDFCLRLRSRGFRNICVPGARLVHHESRSRGSKYDFTDRVLLLDRWESVIDRGDAYYSTNFQRGSTDYRFAYGGFQR